MTVKNADMPAFPQDADWKRDMEQANFPNANAGFPSMEGIGLTKKEYFASVILQALVTSNRIPMSSVVPTSINMADLFFKELEKTNV